MRLRRIIIAVLAIALSAAGLFAAYQASEPRNPELASMIPSGALLYIESPDFHSLLADWNQSSEKQTWLTSDDYAVFSRSRLFGRLAQAQTEFAIAAGIPSNMQFLDQIAGRQSAFAWYDIGKLEFLYITRLPSSSFQQTALWQSRGSFEQRQSGNATFYIRTDPQSRRTVAFAAATDWVILGTREDLVADALALLNSAQSPTIQSEAWYTDCIKAAKSPGDLRMVLNLDKIVPSPYFRSYWIQQNITEMKQYRAAISDLFRTSSAYREERMLLRHQQASDTATIASDVAALSAAVPADAGFYKAWAAPTAAQVTYVLRDKLLDPRPATASATQIAPTIAVNDLNAGQASDLETRIDQAPAPAPGDAWTQLISAIAAMQINGLLEIDSSSQPDSLFPGVHSAVVLMSSSPWDAKQMQKLIADGLNAQTSATHLGTTWTKKGDYFQLDGLVPLDCAVQGNALIISNDESLLTTLALNLRKKPVTDENEIYASAFNHAQESAVFFHTSTLIDHANMRGRQDGSPDSGQPPAFFSGNIASLSRMFSSVTSESIVERSSGQNVTQTVTYQWH